MTYQKLINQTIASVACLSSIFLLTASSVQGQTANNEQNILDSIDSYSNTGSNSSLNQITNVNELSDVSPNDWAYDALKSLVERYGCIGGYPDGTFGKDRPLTRYEFAAALNSCLTQMEQLIASSQTVAEEDLITSQRLSEEFTTELNTLGRRVDELENRTAFLEDHQFSTTTKLRGQVIMSLNSGGFDGDSIVDPSGRQTLATSNPETTLLYRAGIDLTTSFFGTDSLLIRLEGASGSTINNFPGIDNAAGVLEPFFGSNIDYAVEPPTEDGDFGIGRLVYTFKPIPDLAVSLGPDIRATDYADRNSYANLSFLDFSSQLFVNNLILFPVDGPAGGAAIDWRPGDGAFSLRALYAAPEADSPGEQQTRPIIGTAAFTQVLFPNAFRDPNSAGDRGLFGDTHQGTVELEYAPSRNLAVRLQYSGGKLFDNNFDVFGANVEFTLAKKFGIFGRYGYGIYDQTIVGDIKPNYWMAGIASRDLFREGALAGIAVGQPFIADEVGDATQTNYELFYNYPISRWVQVSPSVQVITNAGNQDSNGTVVTGTMRTVFSF
jgi:porin